MYEKTIKSLRLYEKAMQDSDDFKRKFSEQDNPETVEDIHAVETDARTNEAVGTMDIKGKHVHASPKCSF